MYSVTKHYMMFYSDSADHSCVLQMKTVISEHEIECNTEGLYCDTEECCYSCI